MTLMYPVIGLVVIQTGRSGYGWIQTKAKRKAAGVAMRFAIPWGLLVK